MMLLMLRRRIELSSLITLSALMLICNGAAGLDQAEQSRNRTTFDLRHTKRLKDVLNVFDLTILSDNWSRLESALSTNCSKDMQSYLGGLIEARMWAVKMDDATGHYTSGFLYGNNYWMGSMSLCKSIYHDDEDLRRENSGSRTNTGLPFAKAHTQIYNAVYNENPPFLPGFSIVKMLVNETYPTELMRTIYIGICMPSTCSLRDIRAMTAHGYVQLPDTRDVSVLDIRIPTDPNFSIYHDKTFWALIIVTTIVAALIFSGTIYEIVLTRRLRKALRQHDKEMLNNSETSSGIGCGTSDYSDSVRRGSLKKDVEVDLGQHGQHEAAYKELSIALNMTHNSDSGASSDGDPDPDAETDVSHGDAGELANQQQHQPAAQNLSIYAELLLSFSAITNFNAICDRKVGPDTIPSLHGLRAFSMAWIILGHTCIVVFKYSDNMEMRKEVEKNFFFQAITNGAFSVDTFFFISGFLVSYLYFRTNAKGKLNRLPKGSNEFTACTIHFVGLVIYRFVRLTMPYIFVLGVVQVSMQYLATYSIFDPPTMDHITCPQYWWRNILYINTLFPVDEMCMLWSWYLANDTQFYIIGAIILIVGVRHLKISAATIGVFLLVSWITTAIIAFTNNHRPNTDDPLALFDKIYDKPWTRLGPYLIGMSVGWLLFRTNNKIRMSRPIVCIGWLMALLNLFVLIFGLYRSELSRFTAAAYSSLSHSAWSLSLAWITIACSTGYGGYLNTFLSAPCFYPFSRITYCAYLVHPIVIRSMALNSDAPMHLSGDTMAVMFFGLVVTSYLLSFIVSMSFEAPVVTMLKILSPSRKKRLT